MSRSVNHESPTQDDRSASGATFPCLSSTVCSLANGRTCLLCLLSSVLWRPSSVFCQRGEAVLTVHRLLSTVSLATTTLLMLACSPAEQPETVREAIAQARATDPYAFQRGQMVERLHGEGIRSPAVLQAMMTVRRHEFIPTRHEHLAYLIRPLPIGHDQTISSPYIVAYMTEVAEITPGDKVLEIGTGSGYQAAVLAELSDRVYSIEIIPEFAKSARERLTDLGYRVHVRTGNGYLGWPEAAPFDAIVVTAAPDEVPQALVDQLAMGGKMVIPVGVTSQEMIVITRTVTGIHTKRTLSVRFVPMTGKPE